MSPKFSEAVELLLSSFVLAACASSGTSRPAVIPKPVELELRAGHFALDEYSYLSVNDPLLLDMELDQRFLEILEPGTPFDAPRMENTFRRRFPIRLALGGDPQVLGTEGYSLSVTPESVELLAARPVGVFYGLQTLRQLLIEPDEPGGAWSLPCCEVTDSPRFPWRGQLLDVSRHFLPVEFVKSNIDELAALKLNVFHWHLTDDQGWRVPIDALPRLTEVGAWRVDRNDEPWWGRAPAQPGETPTYGGFYTRDELREVVEYARLRGVTVVPEFDMPGHSRAALAAYPGLSCDGQARSVATGGIADENALCPGKEETFAFVETVLDSVLELFPSESIHIGGDECNKAAWRACASCGARMEHEGLANVEELQSYFVRRVEALLSERGRKLVGWDEILEGGLAPGAVVMSWRGEAGGIAAAKAGHEVIMTPSAYCYLDLKQGHPETEPELGYSQLLLSTAYSYDPVPAELSAAEAQMVLGVQGNLWGESIQRAEDARYMLFPRLFAIAEVAWSPLELRDWDDFMVRLEPALEDLEERGIAYAPSLYQVAFDLEDELPDLGVDLRLSTEHGRLDIRYTLDGSAPTAVSPLYKDPIRIRTTTEVRASAFRDATRLGREARRRITLHKGIGRAVTSASDWSPKYHGGGARGLVDGKRGSVEHTDGRWVGFEGQDLDVTVDLGELTPIESVALGCLRAQKSWIFFPSAVEVELSDDGQVYRGVGRATSDAAANVSGETKRDFAVSTSGQVARFVRVRAQSLMACPPWHPGSGGKAWIFADELVIE